MNMLEYLNQATTYLAKSVGKLSIYKWGRLSGDYFMKFVYDMYRFSNYILTENIWCTS